MTGVVDGGAAAATDSAEVCALLPTKKAATGKARTMLRPTSRRHRPRLLQEESCNACAAPAFGACEGSGLGSTERQVELHLELQEWCGLSVDAFSPRFVS